MRVLLCGESWVTHSVHVKGVDSFTTSSYTEGADYLRRALSDSGIEVTYLPGHLVPAEFPQTAGGLAGYAAVILSDIGANSILLAPQTFERSQPVPDRLAVIEGYVRDGGGLLMIGGYLSFAGIEGKARPRPACRDSAPCPRCRQTRGSRRSSAARRRRGRSPR